MTTENLFDGRAHGDLVFRTRPERNFFIGRLSPSQQKEWLRDHPERWQTREDALRDLQARAGTDVDAEPAEPCSTTSANEVQPSGESDGPLPVPAEDKRLPDKPSTNTMALTTANAEATAAAGGEIILGEPLVDTLSGDRSPPLEPTSPALVLATVENETTNAELLRATDVTMGEAAAPNADITPVGPTPSTLGRSGGRELKKQKLPAEISRHGQKRSPERLRLILDSLAEYPVKIGAAKKAGIHRKTLDYWLKCSAAGHAGYVLDWRQVTAKFHEHFISAVDEGVENLLGAAYQRALGYDEPLTYQGRVVYKLDPELLALGCQGRDAYLIDEDGNPVPETVRKQDPKMIRWLLQRLRPEIYGNERKIDVSQRGGVLVVGRASDIQKLEKEFGGEIQDVEFDVEDSSEG